MVRTGVLSGIGLLTAAAMTPVQAQTAPAPPAGQLVETAAINVTVNGEAVPFPGQGPVQKGGAILVPLRGVFEKLGAGVQYEPTTKTIVAVKGQTTVTLRLGDATAYVNGFPRPLAVPADTVNGSTLVPLRFVGEALGAQVKWDPANHVIAVTTDALTAAKLPTPKGTGTPVGGTITGIFPETNSIAYRGPDGEPRRVPLAPNFTVTIRTGEQSREAKLGDLRVGDQVRIQRDDQGNGIALETATDEKRGVVKLIETLPNGDALIRLTNGTAVEILKGAPVKMGVADVDLKDIKPGERVVIRVNPDTNLGLGVAVVTETDPQPAPPTPETPPPAADANPPANVVGAATAAAVAAPAAAATKLEITSVTHDAAGKTLRGGDVVTVTVVGTPGEEVFLSVTKLFETAVAMPLTEKEGTPGTYIGTFNVPQDVTASDVAISATLKHDDASSAPVTASPLLTVDSAGPEVTKLTPADGVTVTTTRPKIEGSYSDAGGKIDPAGTRLFIGETEVTDKAQITDTGFTYQPGAELPAGPVTVAVVAKDALGNETKKEWAFTVKPPVKPITRVSVAPTANRLRAGDVVTVRMEGLPGGTARFTLGPLADQPMLEESPGVYVGTYAVKKGDMMSRATVTVTFTAKEEDIPKTSQSASETITIAAGPPTAPIIDFPAEGTPVGGAVVISGRAEPGSKVRLNVKYEARVIFSNQSAVLDNEDIEVDDKGQWKSNTIPLAIPRNASNVKFTLEAVTIAVTGEVSPAAKVQFKR